MKHSSVHSGSPAKVTSGARVVLSRTLLTLPTYKVGEAEATPLFYDGRQTQHAEARFYPYPAVDKLSKQRTSKDYEAFILENEFVRVVVVPELGGRLFSATDKTNGYELFYKQSVIKPANIGMTGAWISGGIEWCFPHHHRASTFAMVDHSSEEHADGSASIYVGEIEMRHRTKWVVAITLRPNSSAIEAKVRLINRTETAQSVLYWANAAVHTNPNYQYIFPPSSQIASFHCKDAFTHWPVSHEANFKGINLQGLDLSWWRNHPAPASFFMHNMTEDFHGGYDHGRGAGSLHVADHHVVNCAKMFEWGNCPEAELENSKLTDADGHYAELMVGAFSDNQPDYSWMNAHQHREFVHYWFPLRETGLVQQASRAGAVSLDVQPSSKRVRIAVNLTTPEEHARVTLRGRSGDTALHAESVRIGPSEPYVRTISLASALQPEDLELLVQDGNGKPLLRFSPEPPADLPELPKPMSPPPKPAHVQSVDELHRIALRLVQFYNPVLSPYLYIEEALRREPRHRKVNALLGFLFLQRYMFEEAERHLRIAQASDLEHYTTPKSGEVAYHLGLALYSQGRLPEAKDQFHKAAWDSGYEAACRTMLAKLAAASGDLEAACEHAGAAIDAGGKSLAAWEMRAILLRSLGRVEEWGMAMAALPKLDPLSAVHAGEKWLQTPNADNLRALYELLHDAPHNFTELASVYMSLGRFEDAARLLRLGFGASAGVCSKNATLGYYLAHCLSQTGDTEGANLAQKNAEECPFGPHFPYGVDSLRVLNSAISRDPKSARAHYELGTLLYDHQPSRALSNWRVSLELNPKLAFGWRNLAFGLRQAGELGNALEAYKKAIQQDASRPLWWAEWDATMAQAGTSARERLARLAECPREIAQDPAVLWRIALARQLAGDQEGTLSILNNTCFSNYESRRDKHQAYVASCLLRGDQCMESEEWNEAVRNYELALLYPENLEAGMPYHDDQHAHVYYKLALAHLGRGEHNRAETYLRRSVSCKNQLAVSDLNYYQGLALRKLGEEEAAIEQFLKLIRFKTEKFEDDRWYDFFAGYQEHDPVTAQKSRVCLASALGHLGLNEHKKAQQDLKEAISNDPCNIWAQAWARHLKMS